tara:strand:- start:505 stop:1131 length:627 start_codon:yes stop_codon:yes gene_type:complete
MPLSTLSVASVFTGVFHAKSHDGPCFPVAAHACICSRGCPTTACPRCKSRDGMGLGTWGCKASHLCNVRADRELGDATRSATARVTMLTFLTFRATHVRNIFVKRPQRAYWREVNRIAHLATTVRSVGTRLPLHCVVAGDRNSTAEHHLEKYGVRILSGTFLEPPSWASKWHKQARVHLSSAAQSRHSDILPAARPHHSPSTSSVPWH